MEGDMFTQMNSSTDGGELFNLLNSSEDGGNTFARLNSSAEGCDTFPVLNSSTDDLMHRHSQGTVYYLVNISISIILFVLICLGNILILYLVIKHRGVQMTAVRNLLIGGMALHDLATGITVIPIHMVNLLELNDVTHTACLGSNVLTFTIHIVSGYTPLLLALERFVAIVFPFNHPVLLTEKKVYVSLSTIWIYGIFVGFLPLMGWNNLGSQNKRVPYCHPELFVDGRYLGFVYMCNVVPCMIGQVCLYLKIIHTAQVQSNRINVQPKQVDSTSGKPHKSDRRGLLVLALTSVFFVISYLPVIIETAIDFNFYMSKSLEGDLFSHVLFSLGDIFILANSAINPVFYAYSNKEFRIKIKQMLKKMIH